MFLSQPEELIGKHQEAAKELAIKKGWSVLYRKRRLVVCYTLSEKDLCKIIKKAVKAGFKEGVNSDKDGNKGVAVLSDEA